MADRYLNFAHLAANEGWGIDYRICVKYRASSVVILAPHGGMIEPYTSEIAEAIAGSDLSFYAFESLKDGAHGNFHITSHRFDEPKAVDIVGRSRTAVAIHGRRDDVSEAIWLGGRAIELRNSIGISLERAGFDAEPNKRLPGLHPENICNRTLSGQGVQLELPRKLRHRLARQPEILETLCDAVRYAIQMVPDV